ncbi:HET-domain-containing protein [Dichomitus squalens]|uniref:HET-domain-containing protein n=1 Tax=Dichomitus squalens TaxID=114155 RepID=A0A4Q9MKF6_9APHY|nr:HET-domain-containing protein [Dichomitus squalens]
MWLLSTDRAELHYFTDPETVPGSYAILSHVWGKKEQLFHQTPKYDEDLLLQRPNARDAASKKVRQICIIAQQDRFRWLWDDTCCINKDSSAELSEAINSMYRYYSLAAVCYAYLADVPSNRFSCDPEGPFAKSRWQMHGWTLQELIAAPVVKLISSDWQKLGTKMRHARFLSRITNIPVEVLLMDKPVTSFSIAQRMSWAYKRETTRVEDRAYSLMGIFAVNMTTIYGEGERAFQRLQEEIMEQSIDPSLFAWGSFSGMSSHERSAGHEHTKYESYLLARSPDDFNPSDSGRTRFLPNAFRSLTHIDLHSSRMKEIPTFTMTPYGCLCRLMCFGFGELTLAWMGCGWDGFEGETRSLWLLLRRCQDPPPDESKPLYHCVALSTGYRQGSRLVGLSEADWPWASFTLRPQELYIALWHTTPKGQASSPIPLVLQHERIRTPFRITWESVSAAFDGWKLESTPTVEFDWDGEAPIAFCFLRYDGLAQQSTLWFVLGVCDLAEPR